MAMLRSFKARIRPCGVMRMRRQASSCNWRVLMTLVMLEFTPGILQVATEHTRGTGLITRVEEILGDADTALSKPGLYAFSKSIPECATALPDALKSVSDAQQLLEISSQTLQNIRGKVMIAREKIEVCRNLLQPKPDLQAWPRDWKTFYYWISKAEKAVSDADELLRVAIGSPSQEEYPKLLKPSLVHQSSMVKVESSDSVAQVEQVYNEASLDVTNAQQCGSNSIDGTMCQFSQCAQGRNLVSCAVGFAKGVVGGYHGQWYTVTSDQDHPDNPPPGTLRYGLNLARNNQGGVWITFSRDVTIELRAMLWVHSHTTVDGRGFNIIIHQHSIVMSGAKQVILENIQVNSVRGGDTVHIFSGCWKVWVDHVTSFGGDLGLVSVLQGSTDVTISNCKLSNYNFNMLLGASDNDEVDKNMRVTVYRNHFLDSMQRMPHCRWGWCHVANNLYSNWGYYAIGARVNARVKTENNVFIPNRVNEVTPWHPGATPGSFDFSARIESKGDILMNGATFHQFLSATHDVRPPYPNGEYPPIMPADKVRNLVSACAGAQTPKILYWCQRSGYA